MPAVVEQNDGRPVLFRMFRKLLRFAGRLAFRFLILALSFAGGWAAYAQLHPKPLLRDRWAALMEDPKLRAAPGQGGKRLDGAGSLTGGNSGNLSAASTGGSSGFGGKVAFSLEDLMAMRNPIAQGLALAEAVKTADADTCRKWLETLENHPHSGIRETSVGLVMERWTSLDPAGALAAAGDNFGRKATVFRQWAHHDPAAALAAAGKDYHNEIRQGLMETDPEHAASRWKEIAPDSHFPIATLEFALRAQVKKDPEGAMRQVPDGDDYQTNQVRADLFGSWMDRDPDAAFQYARASGDAATRRQLLGKFARHFPDRAEPLLASLEGEEKSAMAMDIATGKTRAAQDPVSTARWLQSQIPAEAFAQSLTDFTRGQTSLSPDKLDGLLALCPAPADRDKMILNLLEGDARASVAAWLKVQPPGGLNEAQKMAAFLSLPSAEAAALVPGGVSLTSRLAMERLHQNFGDMYPVKPKALAANFSGLPESMQTTAVASFLNQENFQVRDGNHTQWKDQLPAAQLSELFASLSPAAQSQTALQFAWRQQSDPATAARTLAIAGSPPDDPATAAVYEAVAGQWAGTDAPAASGWIQTLPPGPARDAATLALIAHQAATDPDGAAKWAGTLQDPVTVMRAQQLLNPGSATAPGVIHSPNPSTP